jgi:endonuclease/exonuclease/phosphatase family metal-dependent hydrolase
VFEQHTGKHARSFPSWMPLLKLDRIYVRGFHIQHAEIHSGAGFLKVSDHAMLTATLYKK